MMSMATAVYFDSTQLNNKVPLCVCTNLLQVERVPAQRRRFEGADPPARLVIQITNVSQRVISSECQSVAIGSNTEVLLVMYAHILTTGV